MKSLKAIATAGLAAAALAAPIVSVTAASAAVTAPAKRCTINWTQKLKSGNAGSLTLTFSNTCGNTVGAEVKCEANNGSKSTDRYSGYRSTPGSVTAGCDNGSYPQHGWFVDKTTGGKKQIF